MTDIAIKKLSPVALNIVVVTVCAALFSGAALAQQKMKKKRQVRNSPVSERAIAEITAPIAFIDAHVHLNDVNLQLQLMQKYRIGKSVVFWGRNSTNASLAQAFQDYPGKFIPFASVSPERGAYRALWQRDDPELVNRLEQQLKTGIFKGIGEISVTHFPGFGFPEADFEPVSPSMKGIMRLAQKYAVPVTIHCEITRIRQFSDLLAEFKNVKVIWAHGGYTPYFLARRMLQAHPNLTYELSARTWLNHPRSSDYTIFKNDREIWNQWRQLIESNPTRFVVGTDASNHSSRRDVAKIASVNLFLAQLSPATRARVAHENLLALVR